jgi:hypothetical protein
MSLSEVREEFLSEADVAPSPIGVAKAVARSTSLVLAAGMLALIRMRRNEVAILGTISALPCRPSRCWQVVASFWLTLPS